MKFENIQIENFRNFKSVNINLGNRNIIFGRNDFGKTNFLAALRFLFDSTIRRKGFEVSDYHQKNTDDDILISIAIKLEDDNDSQFLRARMGGATSFADKDYPRIYIQLKGVFEENKQLGNPLLFWGGSLEALQEIQQKGLISILDNVFDVTYIDPNVSPEELYKKHQSILHKKEDSDKYKVIEEKLKELNQTISSDSRVQTISHKLSGRYNDIRNENIEITLQSEHQVNGVFNHLVPYIHSNTNLDDAQTDFLYPTSGDGRKKILAYALTSYIEELKIEEKKDKRISIFLIEEVENSLHPTMQEAVSRHLFDKENNIYPYLFLTTHSEHMFVYADDVELIRIFKKNQHIDSNSTFYKVPDNYQKTRKNYNALLSRALFSDRVLLVEGMSEKILFDAVLEELLIKNERLTRQQNLKNKDIEILDSDKEMILKEYEDLEKMKVKELSYLTLEQTNILSIEGIGFTDYVQILVKLGIKPVIKTDNDIKKITKINAVNRLGINRCQRLESIITTNNELKEADLIKRYSFTGKWSKTSIKLKRTIKKEIYIEHTQLINDWRGKGIFLSEIELEEDFIEVLKLTTTIGKFKEKYGKSPQELIKYLQDSKKKNMNDFINNYMNVGIAKEIYNHDKFKCLKYLVGESDENN